jgi:hypothetical protein
VAGNFATQRVSHNFRSLFQDTVYRHHSAAPLVSPRLAVGTPFNVCKLHTIAKELWLLSVKRPLAHAGGSKPATLPTPPAELGVRDSEETPLSLIMARLLLVLVLAAALAAGIFSAVATCSAPCGHMHHGGQLAASSDRTLRASLTSQFDAHPASCGRVSAHGPPQLHLPLHSDNHHMLTDESQVRLR